MPELSNIQTYIEIKNKDYSKSLEKFKQLLINLDAWDEPTERAFKNPNWQDENGFVSSELMNLKQRTTKHSGVRVRPLLRVLTPEIDGTLESNWVWYDLLIETEELIEDYFSGKFQEFTFDFIEQLTFEMARNFGTPTFFTNEGDDGEPFDGLRMNNQDQLWKFDYALIPLAHSNLYSNPPDTHQIRTKEQLLECWKSELWKA